MPYFPLVDPVVYLNFIIFQHTGMLLLCTVFEIIDGATLDDGKLKDLESGSHQYVVTCGVSLEFKPGD